MQERSGSAGNDGFNKVTFARDAVATIDGQLKRTLRLLSDLPPADWERGTACTDWRVRDIAAHLADLALNYARSVALGIRGTPTPFLGLDFPNAEAFRKWRRGQLLELAPSRPRVLVDLIASEWDVANGYFKGLVAKMIAFEALGGNPPKPGEEDSGGGVGPLDALAWHATGNWPAARFIGMALFELAIHDWDIRAPADPDATLNPDVERVLLKFVRQWPTYLVRNESIVGPDGGIRLKLGGAEPDLDLGLRDGQVVAEVPNPSATIATDPTTFLLVGSGRRTPVEAAARRAWRVTGDESEAARIIGIYRGL
ncbi:MAG: maleylpyruvate isomerase family mycothiol-dependent enzyme [Chloroflexi bacterium]|nr:maleylpyruvate isomerase family mycothiol-dependent enzyme [Chloroflexota bacterium]